MDTRIKGNQQTEGTYRLQQVDHTKWRTHSIRTPSKKEIPISRTQYQENIRSASETTGWTPVSKDINKRKALTDYNTAITPSGGRPSEARQCPRWKYPYDMLKIQCQIGDTSRQIIFNGRSKSKKCMYYKYTETTTCELLCSSFSNFDIMNMDVWDRITFLVRNVQP